MVPALFSECCCGRCACCFDGGLGSTRENDGVGGLGHRFLVRCLGCVSLDGVVGLGFGMEVCLYSDRL